MEDHKKKQKKPHHCRTPRKTPRFAQSFCLFLSLFSISASARGFDYADALTKSLLYFESQRSGRLPYNQRATWRDHSGLTDGLEQGVSPIPLNPFVQFFFFGFNFKFITGVIKTLPLHESGKLKAFKFLSSS